MKRQIVRFAPWCALMILGVIATPRPASPEPQPGQRHPAIASALRELHNAQDYMREARHDFCGHRRDAMRATDNAINQLQRALECARER